MQKRIALITIWFCIWIIFETILSIYHPFTFTKSYVDDVWTSWLILFSGWYILSLIYFIYLTCINIFTNKRKIKKEWEFLLKEFKKYDIQKNSFDWNSYYATLFSNDYSSTDLKISLVRLMYKIDAKNWELQEKNERKDKKN